MTIKSATIRMPQRRGYSPRAVRRRSGISGASLFRSSLRGFLAFTFLLLFLGLSVYTSYKVKLVASDIGTLEEKYAALQQENIQLNAQLDGMTSNVTLAKLGKRLGLRPPAEDQIITLQK